jgi:hypothetical protein
MSYEEIYNSNGAADPLAIEQQYQTMHTTVAAQLFPEHRF